MKEETSPPESGSAVEDVSLDDELPFDRFDSTPEPEHPEFVWVRAPAPQGTVIWRRYYAPEAPANGLQYLPDVGVEPGPTVPFSEAPATASPQRTKGGPAKVKINVIRLDVSEDEAYVDQKSGILDKKIYVRLAKLGRFPWFKVGQSYMAKRADVLAYLAAEAETARPKVTPPAEVEADIALDDLRRKIGLRPRRGH